VTDQTTQDPAGELDIPELLEPGPEAREMMPSPGTLEGEEAGRDDVSGSLDLVLPEDPEEAVAVLTAELRTAREENAEYVDTIQRLAADFDNFRKRVERDRADLVARASQRLIERLLPILDSFDAALAYEPQTSGEEQILAGMRDTHRLLFEVLAEEGLAVIAASGVPFDPAVHEAVSGPDEVGDGELIVRELRRGYTLRGRVLRAALVTVELA